MSMGFARKEYWSGLPFPSSGCVSDPGTEPASPALTGGFFTTEPPGKPLIPVCVVLCLEAQSFPTLCDSIDCSPPGSSAQRDSPGKNTGVGCHALFQQIFPTQRSNPSLPHCRWILRRVDKYSRPKVVQLQGNTNSSSSNNNKKSFYAPAMELLCSR